MVKWWTSQHTEARTTWQVFCRRPFQVYFANENERIFIQISLKFIPSGSFKISPYIYHVLEFIKQLIKVAWLDIAETMSIWDIIIEIYYRDDSRLAPIQWRTSLQSKAVSRWLGPNLESVLYYIQICWICVHLTIFYPTFQQFAGRRVRFIRPTALIRTRDHFYDTKWCTDPINDDICKIIYHAIWCHVNT